MKYICEKWSYRFYERMSEGRIKCPNFVIVPLTCNGVESSVEKLELCTIELKVFIPVFQKFLDLKDVPQQQRIEMMRDFIGGTINPNYLVRNYER